MSLREKQIGLAQIAHQRGLIGSYTLNAVVNAHDSYDLIELLYLLIESPNDVTALFVQRAAESMS
jgi:hypothetical protein